MSRVDAALAARRRYADERAVEDEAKLRRAVRIARLALERGRITLADLGIASHVEAVL